MTSSEPQTKVPSPGNAKNDSGHISNRVILTVKEMLVHNGYSWEGLLTQAGYPSDLGADKKGYVTWEEYARFCDEVNQLVGGLEEVRRISLKWGVGPQMLPVHRLLRVCVSAEQLYQLFCLLTLSLSFRNLFESDVESEAETKTLRVSIRIMPGYRGSLVWFTSAQGVLAGFPKALGYPMAQVEVVEMSEFHGVYRITPPEMKTLWNRLVGFAQIPLRVFHANQVVAAQESTVRARYLELEERRRELDTVLASAADGIAIVSNEVIRYANPSLARLLEVEAPELLVGRSSLGWASPEVEQELRAWALEDDGKRSAERREFPILTTKGQERLVSVAPPSRVNWQNQEAVLWMVADIGERRQIELAAAEATEKEQRRIADDLHDGLGQEMTAIALQLKVLEGQLAAKGVEQSSRICQLVDLTTRAARHARDIAHGLSPRIVVEQGLVQSLRWLGVHTADLFGMEISIESEVPDERLRASLSVARALAIYRAMQEAVSNARRHGHAKTFSVWITSGEGKLAVRFRDDGVGLNEVKGGSRGMGLKILEQRMARESGSVRIQNRTDGTRGTEVLLEVPWRAGVNNLDPVVDRSRVATRGHGGKLRTVGVIDDHRIVREGVAALLESNGRYVVEIKAGSLEEFDVAARNVDIVIVDLMLGEASGLDAIRSLKSRTPSPRLVAFSMGAEELFRGPAISAGASAFVSKHASPDEIVAALDLLE
jgi:PAS domain S-box-containing protein